MDLLIVTANTMIQIDQFSIAGSFYVCKLALSLHDKWCVLHSYITPYIIYLLKLHRNRFIASN